MKYYIAFIKLDQKTKSKIKGIQGMTCPLEWEYDNANDICLALYAWTNKKKLMKEFKKQRNKSLFIFKTIEVSDNKSLEKDLLKSCFKLDNYLYSYEKGKEESIISTQFENESSCDEGLIFDLFLGTENLIDPEILGYKTLYGLERFGYSYIFFNYCVNDLPFEEDEKIMELGNRQDVFWNNYSYMDRENWQYFNERSMKCNAIKINEFECFISLYGDLFKI